MKRKYIHHDPVVSRPNNSSDSHVSPTLHRQKAALDRLERENGDLKQRLESSQADEQARRKDLIESESVAEGAMADLERTKKRLEEYLDEKVKLEARESEIVKCQLSLTLRLYIYIYIYLGRSRSELSQYMQIASNLRGERDKNLDDVMVFFFFLLPFFR